MTEEIDLKKIDKKLVSSAHSNVYTAINAATQKGVYDLPTAIRLGSDIDIIGLAIKALFQQIEHEESKKKI